jgi:hypothetical protein
MAMLFAVVALLVGAACGAASDGESQASGQPDKPEATVTAQAPGTAASAASLTVEEPTDGSTIEAREVTVRGTAPPGAEVKRDTSGPDPKATANAEGRWEMKVKFDKPGPLELRFFLEKHKEQRVTMTVVHTPPATQAPAKVEKPAEQNVSGPTFVVNMERVGCHERPEENAKVVIHREPGTVQAMDRFIQQADSTWHREKDRRCWTRTEPGPVQMFATVEEAEHVAAPLRPKPAAPAAIGTGGGAGSGTAGGTGVTGPAAGVGQQPSQADRDAAAPCQPRQIKGNANSMIYHMPGQRDYGRTKSNVVCFNTAAEAEAAGYRVAER